MPLASPQVLLYEFVNVEATSFEVVPTEHSVFYRQTRHLYNTLNERAKLSFDCIKHCVSDKF